MENDPKQSLFELIDLVRGYSNIYRGSYLPSRVNQIQAEPGSKIFRESVADHVGALPIVAAYLYPYLNEDLDIGKVLTMLAIHDIGEITVGDVLTVTRSKTQDEINNEQRAALSLLHPVYISLYEEYEGYETTESKFAHSIDKISPNLYELIIDKDIAQARYEHFGFDIIEAVKKDRSKMEWNKFLLEFYDELISQIEARFH